MQECNFEEPTSKEAIHSTLERLFAIAALRYPGLLPNILNIVEHPKTQSIVTGLIGLFRFDPNADAAPDERSWRDNSIEFIRNCAIVLNRDNTNSIAEVAFERYIEQHDLKHYAAKSYHSGPGSLEYLAAMKLTPAQYKQVIAENTIDIWKFIRKPAPAPKFIEWLSYATSLERYSLVEMMLVLAAYVGDEKTTVRYGKFATNFGRMILGNDVVNLNLLSIAAEGFHYQTFKTLAYQRGALTEGLFSAFARNHIYLSKMLLDELVQHDTDEIKLKLNQLDKLILMWMTDKNIEFAIESNTWPQKISIVKNFIRFLNANEIEFNLSKKTFNTLADLQSPLQRLMPIATKSDHCINEFLKNGGAGVMAYYAASSAFDLDTGWLISFAIMTAFIVRMTLTMNSKNNFREPAYRFNLNEHVMDETIKAARPISNRFFAISPCHEAQDRNVEAAWLKQLEANSTEEKTRPNLGKGS